MHDQKNVTPQGYQTGQVHPPKAHGGIIALLLVLVIFLGGIVSALGLMNIHLFRQLNLQKERSMAFHTESVAVPLQREVPEPVALEAGQWDAELVCEPLTPFYQRYLGLSHGVCIAALDQNSALFRQGLRAGDILTHMNGSPVTCEKDIHALLGSRAPAVLSVLREGEKKTVHLTWEEEI